MKRDRPMRLAASTARQALQVYDVCAGSTTTSFEPYCQHQFDFRLKAPI